LYSITTAKCAKHASCGPVGVTARFELAPQPTLIFALLLVVTARCYHLRYCPFVALVVASSSAR
jgi:hypothetical protein